MTQAVLLGEDDLQESWQLGRLAFGVGPDATPPTWPRPFDALGIRDDRGRLVAKASLQDYTQWWGGRRVAMGGVAGVAVHPDARGRGLASLLVRELTGLMGARGQGLSALFPTVVGLYRALDWEVVGSLDETVLTTGDLRAPAGATGGRQVRTAGPRVRTAEHAEAPELHALYQAHAQEGAGLLTRDGPMFTDGPVGVLDGDVVSVVEGPGGALLGYVRYDRGRGYRGEAELFVWELLSVDPASSRALLATVAGWHPVAPRTRWRGSTDALGLLLAAAVPPTARRQPWMLRVVDPALAVTARGWAADCDVELVLDGRPWRWQVRDGDGTLDPGAAGSVTRGPTLHPRGLALLYAGAADTAAVRRAGLLDGPLPGLDAALAGPRPGLLDYF